MREIALREFRTRGAKALENVPAEETVLLAGQQGPAYFLVPVLGDITQQDRELRRAMAKASLRENWRRVRESSRPLSDEEIQQEIGAVRRLRRRTAR
jgi:antitoxin (DNA-binding transcriptional repressor) of toxin-antitoxin stability system